VKNKTTLKLAFVAIFFYLLILLPAANLLTNFINQRLTDTRSAELHRIIDTEEASVLEQIRSIGSDESIINLISQQNVEQLLSSLEAERKAYGLGTIAAVDKDGVSLLRTSATGDSGSYVLQSTIWGRAADQNQSIVAVGVAKNYPLILAADQPIARDGKFIGAILGGYLIDNNYANVLKTKYLSKNAEVILYSYEDGVLGSTFSDPDTQVALSNEFNVGSDWIREGRDNVPIMVGGRSYQIKNITFADTEGGIITGGILVFYPKIESMRFFASAVFAVLIICLIALLRWKFLLRKPRLRKLIIAMVIISIAISSYMINEFWYLFSKTVIVKEPQTVIYNSSLSLFPESDVFSLTSSGRVAVKINTGGEAINAVQLNLKFDPSIVKIQEIVMEDSICNKNFIIEKKIDNDSGEAHISCGLSSPGFQGNNGNVAELIFSPQTEGEFALEFLDGTRVLANDGLGTNVLRFFENGNFRVIDFDKQKEAASSEQGLISSLTKRPIVFSSSHPNQERWSKEKEVVFYWPIITAGDYIYSLDNDPNGTPNPSNVVKNNLLSLTIQTDGVYYFHLAARNKARIGPEANYKIKIDNTAPDMPTIKIDKPITQRGETTRFEFASFDKDSGLQNNFYYSLDSGTFLPVGASLSTSFDSIGQHKITVRAFDNAGNFSNSQALVDVSGQTVFENIWWKIKSFVTAIF
jgi:hypothetical protein